MTVTASRQLNAVAPTADRIDAQGSEFPTTYTTSFSAMGTTVHVLIVGGEPEQLDQSKLLVSQLESKWSRFQPESEISKLNRANGNPCVVSQPTFELVAKAIAAWSASGGAFDPTIETSLRTAGYDRPFKELETMSVHGSDLSAGQPAELKASPTPDGIWLDRTARLVQLPPGTTLDLGGIAKGATADIVAEKLLATGAQGCCVNIGGDIRALGKPPRQTGWTVKLDVPGCELPAIALNAGAVCTSTTRVRSWTNRNGAVEHHIRDPRSGRATTSDLESVVVLAERAIQAEVLTKMILVGGSARASEIFESSRTTGFTVSNKGDVIAMDGIQQFIVGCQ